MTTSPNRDVALARLAATQHGLLSRTQIYQNGGDSNFVARRITRGHYTEVADHVVALAGAPPTWHRAVLAAVLSSGPDAVASHETAAVLYGLLDRRPGLIDVTTPGPLPRRRSWNAHRSRDLIGRYVTEHNAIPITTPARTVLDLAGVKPWLTARVADAAVRLDLMTHADLGRMVEEVARKGRPGITACRELVVSRLEWSDRNESELEDRFLGLLAGAGLPLPQPQLVILDRGGNFVCRVDYAYEEQRAAIWLDGYRFHRDEAIFRRDRTVQNKVVALGWQPYRYTWWDVDLRPEALCAEMARLLRSDAA